LTRGVDCQFTADVTSLAGINARQPRRPFAVFGILSAGNINPAAVKDWRGDDVIPRAQRSNCQQRRLEVDIKFPDQFAR